VELEAEEPVHTRLAAAGAPREDLMGVDAAVVADLQRSRVDKRDAAALPFPALQVAAQGDERRRHQLNEALVADEPGEGPHVPLEHALGVVSLEVAVTGGVEERDDGHHFRQAQCRRPVASARLKQSLLPEWFKEQTEVVYVAEKR
jgi:hypothetical protein